MKQYLVWGIGLLAGVGAAHAEQSILQNNWSLSSALASAQAKCLSPEIRTFVFDATEVVDTLDQETSLDEHMLKSLLLQQADFRGAIARAKESQTPECLRALENARSALVAYVASNGSFVPQPRKDNLPVVRKLPIPKLPPTGTTDALTFLKSLIQKSARYARIEDLGDGRKLYRFRTRAENSELSYATCEIVFAVDEAKNSITGGWVAPPYNKWGRGLDMDINITRGSKKEYTDYRVVEGRLIYSQLNAHGKVAYETHVIPAADGSIERLVYVDPGTSKQRNRNLACWVTKFTTYDDDSPVTHGASP